MSPRVAVPTFLLALLLASLCAVPRARSQELSPDPAVALRAITESRLDPDRAVPVRSAKLSVGLATLHLDEGTLVRFTELHSPLVRNDLGAVVGERRPVFALA